VDKRFAPAPGSMSEQEPRPEQDVLNMEWDNDDAQELDEDFRNADNMIEIDIDDDDDPPADSDEDDDDDDGDQVLADGADAEDPDDEFAGIDDSMASVEHKEAVLSVAISPADRRIFVTGGQDDVAVLWALEEVRFGGGLKCVERARLLGHTDSVNQVGFSHDGQYVATCSYDATIKIWTVATGALLHTLEGPAKEVEWVIWHPKGHAILAGSTDTMAWMWWAPTGKLMQIFAGHAQGVSSGCWALGGKLICTGSEDRSLIVWNPRAGTPQQHIKHLHESNVITMCSHPTQPIIVTGSEDATAKVVHAENGKVLSTLGGHSESVEQVAFSNAPADGMLLLGTCSMDGRVLVFDGKTFESRCSLTDHVDKGGVTGFKWFPAGNTLHLSNFLCTAALDRTSRIFNALTGQCLHTLRGHTDSILDLDCMLVDGPDGTPNQQVCVILASDDKTCKVFVKPMQAGNEASASGPQARQPTLTGMSVAPAEMAAGSAGYSPGAEPPVAAAQAPSAQSPQT